VIPSVCRQWRQLAISVRYIWSQIDLSKENSKSPAPLKAASLWIERAQGAPIHSWFCGIGHQAGSFGQSRCMLGLAGLIPKIQHNIRVPHYRRKTTQRILIGIFVRCPIYALYSWTIQWSDPHFSMRAAEMTYNHLGLDISMGRIRDFYHVDDDDGSPPMSGVSPACKIVLVNYPRTNASTLHLEETILRYAKTVVANSGLIVVDHYEEWDQLAQKHNM
jgi:hypothetical protein